MYIHPAEILQKITFPETDVGLMNPCGKQKINTFRGKTVNPDYRRVFRGVHVLLQMFSFSPFLIFHFFTLFIDVREQFQSKQKSPPRAAFENESTCTAWAVSFSAANDLSQIALQLLAFAVYLTTAITSRILIVAELQSFFLHFLYSDASGMLTL